MAVWFLRIAVLYILFGVIFGLVIGIAGKLGFANVHAHVNLLGWATLALSGLIYTAYPSAGNTKLAVAHFWLQNIGLPIFVAGLFIIDFGNESLGIPFTSSGAIVAILGIAALTINVWANVKTPA